MIETDDLEQAAYHEAGHVVLLFVLRGNDDPVSFIDLEEEDQSYSIDVSGLGPFDTLCTLAVMCAGFVAEDIRFGCGYPTGHLEDVDSFWNGGGEIVVDLPSSYAQPRGADDLEELTELMNTLQETHADELLPSVVLWYCGIAACDLGDKNTSQSWLKTYISVASREMRRP